MPVGFREPSKSFNRLLQLTLGNFLKAAYNIKANKSCLADLKPPYVLLANHTNTWDPFIISTFVKEPVCYIASDFHFRRPLLRILLGLVGAIPKSKGVSDVETIRSIIKAQKSGNIIGIFPEGARSWDGTTLEIIPATSKLVKSLKLPVVACIMKGAHLSLPRWGKKRRRGTIELDFKLALTPDKIKSMTVDEIQKEITEALKWDEYSWQKQYRIPFTGKEAARYLELYLFTCPSCKSTGTLVSQDDKLSCKACGYSVRFNKYGLFERGKSDPVFETPSQWDAWQLELLSERLYSAGDEPLFSDLMAVMKKGMKASPLKKQGSGSLTLYADRIEYKGKTGIIKFEISKISGATVQFNDVFEFYYERVLYTFLFEKKRVSAYKWVNAVEILQKNYIRHGG